MSNLSLYETVAVADVPAARRIFELEMKRPDNDTFSNFGGVTREMMRCRGFAGRRWAQVLTTDPIPQYLREHLTGLTEKAPGSAILRYRKLLRSDAEHRFIVWLLASVDVAARLLVHYGILHFDVERIMAWAVEQGGYHVADKEMDDAPAKLQRFLGEHVSGCVVVSDAYDPKNGPVTPYVEPKHNLVMRAETKTKKLYIAQDVLKKWCTRNRIPFGSFSRALMQAELLVARSRSITLGAGTMIPSVRTYCWEIDTDHPAISGALREVTAAPVVKAQ